MGFSRRRSLRSLRRWKVSSSKSSRMTGQGSEARTWYPQSPERGQRVHDVMSGAGIRHRRSQRCHDRIRTCQHDGKEYESMRSGHVTAKKRTCDSVRAREHGSLRALAPRMSASSNLNAPLASLARGAWRSMEEHGRTTTKY